MICGNQSKYSASEYSLQNLSKCRT